MSSISLLVQNTLCFLTQTNIHYQTSEQRTPKPPLDLAIVAKTARAPLMFKYCIIFGLSLMDFPQKNWQVATRAKYCDPNSILPDSKVATCKSPYWRVWTMLRLSWPSCTSAKLDFFCLREIHFLSLCHVHGINKERFEGLEIFYDVLVAIIESHKSKVSPYSGFSWHSDSSIQGKLNEIMDGRAHRLFKSIQLER